MEAGWGSQRRPRVELYDLVMDPVEMRNLAPQPEFAEILENLDGRLRHWMESTNDPLLTGDVPAPRGALLNDPAGISAREPYLSAVS